MTGERRLFLIRHGQSDFDSEDFRISPRGRQWDPRLSQEGRDQADALAARLVLMDAPATVVTSPFRRCVETIRPFTERAGIEPTVDEAVGEVFIGEWEGLSFEEIVSGDEELARRFRDSEAMFGLAPGGESGRELRARVVPAVERILEDHPGGDVVVVTHGGVLNAYLGHVLGIDQDMFFLPENTSINTVTVQGSRRTMRFLNDTRHVTEPRLFVPPPETKAR
jgi:2,3-bisphosphoglycerate-dependent phosphoglycerate mutase